MGRCVHEADEKWGGESKGADEKWGGESVTPSLLLMLRLAKMFEKHSKHMEENYWAPPDTSV